MVKQIEFIIKKITVNIMFILKCFYFRGDDRIIAKLISTQMQTYFTTNYDVPCNLWIMPNKIILGG